MPLPHLARGLSEEKPCLIRVTALGLGNSAYSNKDPLTFELFNGDDSYENQKIPESDEHAVGFDFGMDRNKLSMDSPAEQYKSENYWLGLSD
jgi:hypothetical protein